MRKRRLNQITAALLLAATFLTAFPGEFAADGIVMPIGIADLAEKDFLRDPESDEKIEVPLEGAMFIANLALSLEGDKSVSVPEIKKAAKEDPPVIQAMVKRETARRNSIYNKLAISQVESYVNIRTEANSEAEVVGKIYNNAAATILERVEVADGLWYKISSGQVEGYIKAEYFATGDDAAELATKIGMVYAKVTTESLRLRERPDLGSKTISVLSKDTEYLVEEEGEEFVKISIDNDIVGYAQRDYLEISVKYDVAISIEEERKKAEEEAKRKAEAAAAKAKLEEERKRKEAEKTKKTTTQPKTTAAPKTTAETGETKGWQDNGSSALRDAIVAEAVQYVGVLKYVLGGNSLETGTDCSGFVQIIYRKFGIKLPRVSDEQGYCGESVKAEDMRPGDLIYYKGHIGIYIGNGEVCHCSTSKSWPNTKISTWNYRKVYGIRNVIGD